MKLPVWLANAKGDNLPSAHTAYGSTATAQAGDTQCHTNDVREEK